MGLETLAKVAVETKELADEVGKKIGEFTGDKIDSDKRINPLTESDASANESGMSGLEKTMAKVHGYSDSAISLANNLSELKNDVYYSKDVQKDTAEPPKQLELLKSQNLYEGRINDIKVLKNPEIDNPDFLNKKNTLLRGGQKVEVSNIDLMRNGKAPIGNDGKPIELHHCNQTQKSTIAELESTFHHQNHKDLHNNPGNFPSQIERRQFANERENHWKNRALELEVKGIV